MFSANVPPDFDVSDQFRLPYERQQVPFLSNLLLPGSYTFVALKS